MKTTTLCAILLLFNQVLYSQKDVLNNCLQEDTRIFINLNPREEGWQICHVDGGESVYPFIILGGLKSNRRFLGGFGLENMNVWAAGFSGQDGLYKIKSAKKTKEYECGNIRIVKIEIVVDLASEDEKNSEMLKETSVEFGTGRKKMIVNKRTIFDYKVKVTNQLKEFIEVNNIDDIKYCCGGAICSSAFVY